MSATTSAPAITLGRVKPVPVDTPMPDIAKGGFQISSDVMVKANNGGSPPRWAMSVSPQQLKVMSDIVKDASYLGGMDMKFVTELDPRFNTNNGPEWVFHGTPTSWDKLYAAGGFYPTGGNISLEDHFFSSASKLTAYISTTRYLPTAASFAAKGLSGGFGYIYLIYITQIGIVGNDSQAEVAVPGNIPIDNVFMFRYLGTDGFVFQNLDFRLQTVTPDLVRQGIQLLGGK